MPLTVMEADLLTPLTAHGNMLRLAFGRLLMQATQLPHTMMEGIRLRFAHCAASSTPTDFVVNGMKIIAQRYCPRHLWGIGTTHVTSVVQKEVTYFVLSSVLCREGFGLILVCFGGLSRGG